MTGDRAIAIVFSVICAGLVAVWTTGPPGRAPGAVPSPTGVVQRDEAAERELCDRARAGSATAEWLAEQSRRAEIRYALATMAAAGDVEQLLHSCNRAGYR
jgi:hypothetical protein